MSEKLQVGIYKFMDEITELKQGMKPKKVSINVLYLKKILNSKGFRIQKIQPNLLSRFNISLFFKRTLSEIRWKKFISKIAEPNEPILKYKNINSESYILVLENISTKIIYATTGGFGHTALQGLIEGDFGLEILSRLVKADDRTLRSTKEKNLTGGVLGEVKFFRHDYNLNENENFGNFYQELHSSLNRNLLIKTFGFSQTEIDSDCLCVAKNSFTIKKSVDFDQLITIIENCEHLIKTKDPIVEINGVIKLNKSHKALIKDLEKELDKSIQDTYLGKSNEISIELCHKDFDKYLHADTFILKLKINNSETEYEFEEPIRNIDQIIDKISSINNKLHSRKLLSLAYSAYIVTKTNNGDILTDDLLKNHFYTEVSFNGKSYFLSDSDWFEIKSSFTKKLNDQCQEFIDANTSAIKLKKWNYPTDSENDFNATHIGEKDFLVFDKFTAENIEVCDILFWDKANIYFVHVKAGFDNSMRDLSHQVFIAARRVKEDSKTGYEFIEKLYDNVKNSNGQSTYSVNAKNQLSTITKSDFSNLFKQKRPIFVLAVLDKANAKRSISQIDKFDSNIAKFSLHELVKNMRNLAMDFEIIEV